MIGPNSWAITADASWFGWATQAPTAPTSQFHDGEFREGGWVTPEFLREPWNIHRWNPETRQWEMWNKHLGHWQRTTRRDAVKALARGGWRLKYDDTWAEPVAPSPAPGATT